MLKIRKGAFADVIFFYAGLDFEDFVQDAECVVIEQEQAGQVFDTPEDRARWPR